MKKTIGTTTISVIELNQSDIEKILIRHFGFSFTNSMNTQYEFGYNSASELVPLMKLSSKIKS